MTFGQRVKIARENAGLTQSELAKKVGFNSYTTISKIESDNSNTTRDKIVAIAKATNVSPMFLMGYDKSNDISPTIKNIIELAKSLNYDGQKVLENYAEFLSNSDAYKLSDYEQLPYVASSNLFDDHSNDDELAEQVKKWQEDEY